jgi:hypothetical protein
LFKHSIAGSELFDSLLFRAKFTQQPFSIDLELARLLAARPLLAPHGRKN